MKDCSEAVFFLWKHLKLYNLTTTNATLMNLTKIMYLHKVFNMAKDWGVKNGEPKTSQNQPENCFLAEFQVFFKNKIKTVTCLMHYVALHHWSKFQINLTKFWWVTSKKPTRSSLKLCFWLVWKHIKFQNLWTANRDVNETYSRYAPPEHLWYIKNEKIRVQMNGWMGVQRKKAPENVMKLRKYWLWHHLKPV